MHAVSKQPGEQLCLALNMGAANTTNDRCNLHLSDTSNATWMCREVLATLQRQACHGKTKKQQQMMLGWCSQAEQTAKGWQQDQINLLYTKFFKHINIWFCVYSFLKGKNRSEPQSLWNHNGCITMRKPTWKSFTIKNIFYSLTAACNHCHLLPYVKIFASEITNKYEKKLQVWHFQTKKKGVLNSLEFRPRFAQQLFPSSPHWCSMLTDSKEVLLYPTQHGRSRDWSSNICFPFCPLI